MPAAAEARDSAMAANLLALGTVVVPWRIARRQSGTPCSEPHESPTSNGPHGLTRVNPTPLPSPGAAVAAAGATADAALQDRAVRDTRLAEQLSAAAGGDVTAFEAFYDTMVGHAHALARRMVRPGDVADVLSDAFFQAWRDAARFDAERGSAATWVLTIVRSRALDLLRRQRAAHESEHDEQALAELAADAPGPEALLAGSQSNDRLHVALAALSANERWVLGLAYYRDMSHHEISVATGMPLGTVKSLIRRAQTRLREQLTL